MEFDINKLFAKPGTKIDIESYDPKYTGNYGKKSAKKALKENTNELQEIQEMFYADDRYSLLIVLQASDAAGKDGAIRHVMGGINPQGCRVHSFKSPSKNELEHDFIWRHYKELPERGMIEIFNRSYYENVLVTKVHPVLLIISSKAFLYLSQYFLSFKSPVLNVQCFSGVSSLAKNLFFCSSLETFKKNLIILVPAWCI